MSPEKYREWLLGKFNPVLPEPVFKIYMDYLQSNKDDLDAFSKVMAAYINRIEELDRGKRKD